MLSPAAQAADPTTAVLWIAVAIYLVGVLGIIIPILPGLLLCVGAVLVWAIVTTGPLAWGTFAVVAVLCVVGMVLQYLLPGRAMQREGVGNMTLALGAVGGIIGFFVIPVVGLPVGFVAGIHAAEYLRYRDHARAWSATKSALRGVLRSMGIELATSVVMAFAWVGGIVLH